MQELIYVGDKIKLSRSKRSKWWKVIGLIPPLPFTNGTNKILVIRDRRKKIVAVERVKSKDSKNSKKIDE